MTSAHMAGPRCKPKRTRRDLAWQWARSVAAASLMAWQYSQHATID